MLAYMMWAAFVRLRRDRVKTERERSRGRFAFRRPKERLRFLLKRSFQVSEEEAPWEKPLVSSLSDVPAEPKEKQESETAG